MWIKPEKRLPDKERVYKVIMERLIVGGTFETEFSFLPKSVFNIIVWEGESNLYKILYWWDTYSLKVNHYYVGKNKK